MTIRLSNAALINGCIVDSGTRLDDVVVFADIAACVRALLPDAFDLDAEVGGVIVFLL